ncbi:MAG: hypothetical protein HYY25_17060 [Candidatus Wallbacteria bacterium]|nr:hypothetical protein [Candidatus Wallbacteria bacterium]
MVRRGTNLDDLIVELSGASNETELLGALERLEMTRKSIDLEFGGSVALAGQEPETIPSALDLPIPPDVEGVSSWDIEQRRRRAQYKSGAHSQARQRVAAGGRSKAAGAPAAVAAGYGSALSAPAKPARRGVAKQAGRTRSPEQETTDTAASALEDASQQPSERQTPPLADAAAALCRRVFGLASDPARLLLAAEIFGPPIAMRDGFLPPPADWDVRPGSAPQRGLAPESPAPVTAPPLTSTAEPAEPGEPRADVDALRPAPPEARPDDQEDSEEELTPEAIFRYAVQAVMADRKISPQETQFFRGLRGVLKLPEEEEHRIVGQEKERIRSQLSLPQVGSLDAEALYRRCFETARRDRMITSRERHLLRQLAGLLAISDDRRSELEDGRSS